MRMTAVLMVTEGGLRARRRRDRSHARRGAERPGMGAQRLQLRGATQGGRQLLRDHGGLRPGGGHLRGGRILRERDRRGGAQRRLTRALTKRRIGRFARAEMIVRHRAGAEPASAGCWRELSVSGAQIGGGDNDVRICVHSSH